MTHRRGFIVIGLLILLVLAWLGWHTLTNWLSGDFHPVRTLAEVCAVLFIFHFGKRLADKTLEPKSGPPS